MLVRCRTREMEPLMFVFLTDTAALEFTWDVCQEPELIANLIERGLGCCVGFW